MDCVHNVGGGEGAGNNKRSLVPLYVHNTIPLKASQAIVLGMGMRLDKPWLVVWVMCMVLPVTQVHVSYKM